MRELEVRALMEESVDRVLDRLVRLGFASQGATLQTDYIFDRPDGSLFKQGSKIRIRVEGEGAELTYKSSLLARSDVSVRDEITLTLRPSDVRAARDLLSSLGYPLLFILPKRRTVLTGRNVQVTLDTYPIIGLVLEIEGESELDILQAASFIEPSIQFANYRLAELLKQRLERSGSTFQDSMAAEEQAWGLSFGDLALALGVKEEDV